MVERPLRMSFSVTPQKIDILKNEKIKEKRITDLLIKLQDEEFTNRDDFKKAINVILKENNIKSVTKNDWTLIFKIFGEKKEEADICLDGKGNPEADSELRDTETVPLTETIEEYMAREVLPYAPDAWVDETKTKVGYEIPFTRHFYEYVPPRPSQEILKDIMASEERMMATLKELLGND